MKKLYVLSLFVFSFLSSYSQTYENSWINYSQPYYKIKVAQDGIYRVYWGTFNASQIPVSSWDASRIQVFKDGVEQHLYVFDSDSNNHIDNSSDFIEFYAEKNKGLVDTKLYDDPLWQPNKDYSLVTDTAIYFLTVSNSAAGKRMVVDSDTTYSSYSPADYFIKEYSLEEHTYYNVGDKDQDINYTSAEGWVGSVLQTDGSSSSSVSKPVPTQNVYSGGPNVEVRTIVAGANNNLHHITITAPGISTDTIFTGYLVTRYSYFVSPSLITSNSTIFNYSIVPFVGYTDHVAFVSLNVKYPHTFSLENASSFKMLVPDAIGQSKSRFDISNFNFNGTPAILYDLTNHKRIVVTQTGTSSLKALVDNDGTSSPKWCYLSSASQVQNVNRVFSSTYITGLPGFFNNYLPLEKDSAYLIVTNKSLLNEVNTSGGYKDYRNSTTGNKVLVFDVDELYDQFSYGIKNHPLAIRNFCHYLLDKWINSAPPQAIFIIGKSIRAEIFRGSPYVTDKCLVGTYGYPASDMLMVSRTNGSLWYPVIPIGRLSAQSTADVANYLSKVKEYEAAQSQPPQEWMKEVLHFGGGDVSLQQGQLRDYLNQMKDVIEDSLYGANVTSYFKNSPDPIIINQSDSLQAKINNGVSFMHFFGHASGSSFDISTDVPENYNNRGRYPVILASSCFAGDVHSTEQSVGELFVLQKDKAAIGFLASVGLGNPYYLYRYDTTLYHQLAYRNYGKSVAKIVQESIRQLEISNPNDYGLEQTVHEMSLQGDPNIKLNNWAKPDYIALENNVSFTPLNITSELDTFSLHFITRNYGKAIPDSFHIIITRTFPDGTDSVYSFTRSKCFYADTLNVVMKTGGLNGAGINNFKIKVDLPDSVDEIENYSNNETASSLFIISNDIVPVYPAKFAIHPNNTVTLKASTVNPLGPVRNYKFEIDTAYFNDNPSTRSSLYRSGFVTSSGGVVSWSPPSPYILLDSVVYYWRVFDDTTVVHKNESSFIYINGKTGWSQAHFYQFKNDAYKNSSSDSTNRKFDFSPNAVALDVHTVGSPTSAQEEFTVGYTLNLASADYSTCGNFNGALHVAIIDSLTLLPLSNCGMREGQWNKYLNVTPGDCGWYPGLTYSNCHARPSNYFVYPLSDSQGLDSLRQFINSVPNGQYLLFYSWKTYAYSTCAPSLKNMFTDLNFPDFNSLPDSVPFIFFMRKGDVSSEQHVFGTSATDVIDLHTSMQTQWYRGNIFSQTIGPASRWTNLHWEQHPLEAGSDADTVSLSVQAYNVSSDRWDTLVYNLSPTVSDTTLGWIDANQYPYLKLDVSLQDITHRTPPQMDRWQIYFDEIPECALNAARHFSFYKDNISEGDNLKLSIAIDNISNLPMDSLNVSFYLYDKNRLRHNLKTYKLDSLRVGQSLVADLATDSTFGLNGNNSLWVEANPLGTLHQQEQFHYNNLAEIKFNMSRDVTNPVLDVVFDGIHILNEDIVSGHPDIVIKLKDENKFLALNDTSNFRVYIKSPASNTMTRIYFDSPLAGNMRFSPAVLPNNSCNIEYNPELTEDGIYTLEVEATDASKNESGKYTYRISFEVINKSTITEILNYPNPFSTSTRFVFTLTGNEVPDRMRIRIMTVSGKVVREIMRQELGNIHIGRNITEYAWDGKDEYGNQLANGVYFYKVTTDFSTGKDLEHRDSEADKFFKKGWGKMYLMR